jgi:hypothetical protein
MAASSKVPFAELERNWKTQHRKLRDKIYKEALEEAGLDD